MKSVRDESIAQIQQTPDEQVLVSEFDWAKLIISFDKDISNNSFEISPQVQKSTFHNLSIFYT
jgi:hypothetical protein